MKCANRLLDLAEKTKDDPNFSRELRHKIEVLILVAKRCEIRPDSGHPFKQR